MFVEERKQKILEILKQKEKITVNELSNKFSVSKVIIRKDLCDLEKENLLVRTHGGAISQKKIVDSKILNNIEKNKFDIKMELAQKILSTLKNDDMIFLDGSSVTILVAILLQKKKIDISIITNSVEIQKILSENKFIKVISLGGVYDLTSNSFIGEITKANIKLFNPNKVFINTKGINLENMSLSTSSMEKGEFKRAALKNGYEKFIIAQNNRFFQDALYNFFSLGEGMTIISDSNLDSKIEEKLLKNNINIIK